MATEETTPATTEETIVGPVPTEEDRYLFDFDRLVIELEQLIQKEAADRAAILAIETPDTEVLRGKLTDWALRGFPDGYALFSVPIDVPLVCSDGVRRELFPYIEYVAGVPISEPLKRLTNKLKGMHVECSYSGTTITVHVFKDLPSYTGGYSEDTTQDSTSTPDILLPLDAPAQTEYENNT